MLLKNDFNPKAVTVILIDELDLHLHPKWQKTIVDDLKRTFPNCQFIISTHSHFGVQALQASELFDISTMEYAEGNGSYNGWSIDTIQEEKMGVEKPPHYITDNEYVVIDAFEFNLILNNSPLWEFMLYLSYDSIYDHFRYGGTN